MNIKRVFSKYFWNDIWYKITAFFNPRQKWLTKHIPNIWKDKPELIQDILFACLVHYVEEENGLHDESFYKKDLDDGYISKDYYDHGVEWNNDLREVYDYIKTERPELENRSTFENAQDHIAHMQLIDTKDVWAMTTIAKYSQYLWT
jgi:hypothetical protein